MARIHKFPRYALIYVYVYVYVYVYAYVYAYAYVYVYVYIYIDIDIDIDIDIYSIQMCWSQFNKMRCHICFGYGICLTRLVIDTLI